MNIVGILIQAFLEHQARSHADRFREAGARAAEAGRRVAIAGAFVVFGLVLLLAGLIIGLVDFGLQIDRQAGIVYSGLMISATILAVIAVFSFITAWIFSREGRIEAQRAAEAEPPKSELRLVLEQLAVMLLKDFAEAHKRRSETYDENYQQAEASQRS